MSYLNEQKRTLSFRRLPFAAKRRRARPVVAAARRALRILLVIVPVVAVAGWIVGSKEFVLSEIETRGAERVDRKWVEAELVSAMGESLLLTDLEPIRGRLSVHPWISTLRLKKELPRRLIVSIDEHVPRALHETAEGRFLLSELGERITPIGVSDENPVASGLVIDDPSAAAAPTQLARAISVARELSQSSIAWARRPSHARILSPEDLEFTFLDAEFSIRMRSGGDGPELERQIATVDDLLPQLRDRFGRLSVVDLRFERRIVLGAEGETNGNARRGVARTGLRGTRAPISSGRKTQKTVVLGNEPGSLGQWTTSPFVAQQV